jgi:8-oxo-dGTP pyrophosphatase MutT (NUDIX family)
MREELAAGGLVYCHDHDSLLVAIILDKHDNWGLPKGHLEEAETAEQAALREIGEETGLQCTLGALIQRISYPIVKKGEQRLKIVDYFLARSACAALTPAEEEGITQVRWVSPEVALNMVTYAQVREVLRRGLEILQSDAGMTAE